MENYTYYQYCNYYGVFEPYGNITELEVKELIKGSAYLGNGFYLLSTFEERKKPTLIFIAKEKHHYKNYYDVLCEDFKYSGFIQDFNFLMGCIKSKKHLLKGVCRIKPEAIKPVITYDFDGLDSDLLNEIQEDGFGNEVWTIERPYLYWDINKDSYYFINSQLQNHYVRASFIDSYL